jgi:iron complex outermembrane receptor protein
MKTDTPIGYTRLAAAVALACASSAAMQARAQDQNQGPVDEITVTGSFISRPADRPRPVSVMDAAEIQANQQITIAEVVRDMPQISSANTTNNWQFATNSINLRGLGERSTLVLLNGQRVTIDANAGSQVDVNNLAPTIMLERMELLLDGASALYGSDAVAGVANFITRDRFEGIEFNVSSQWAQTQTDVPEIVASGIFGTAGEDSNLVMAFELQRREDKLQEEDRFSAERLGYGLQTALWNPGSFNGTTFNSWYADPLCNSAELGGTPGVNERSDPTGYKQPGPDFCRGNLALQRTNTPEQTLMTGMAVFTKDFDAGGLETFRVEANYARAEAQSSYGTGVPLLALPSVSGVVPILPASNPGVYDAWYRTGGTGTPIGGTLGADYTNGTFPYQAYDTIFSRQLSPLDGDDVSQDAKSTQNTYRLLLSVDGVFGEGDWDWRFTGTMSRNDQRDSVLDTITDRYMRAVQGYGGPGCKWNFVDGVNNDPSVQAGTGPCQYWNPFASRLISDPDNTTPINSNDPNSPLVRDLYNSPELLDWMMFGGQNINEAKFRSFEFVSTADLWEMGGGATGLALGAQYRKQDLAIGVDPIQKDGGLGFSPQILRDWWSVRDTKAVFAELVLFPSDTFELDIAARYEDTLGQSSTEPKISMLWTPTDNLYVRATAGSSFRLASENQLFGIGGGSVARQTIGGEVTQATGIAVGNENLVPETSDNWTLGFTWDVTDSFTIDLTYWNYKFTNLVTSTSAEQTLTADLLDGYAVTNGPANWSDPAFIAANEASPNPLFFGRANEYCEITRGWTSAQGPLPAGCLTGFDFSIFRSSWINQDVVETDGFDLTLDWRKQLGGGGVFGTRFIGAFTERYAGIAAQTGQLVDVVGTDGFAVNGVGTNPDLRANLIVTYAKGSQNLRGTFRYISGTKLTDPNPLRVAFDESAYTQLDLVYAWDVPTERAGRLSVAVLNVTDVEPPLSPNGLVTYNQALYDGRGRMFRVQWDQSF